MKVAIIFPGGYDKIEKTAEQLKNEMEKKGIEVEKLSIADSREDFGTKPLYGLDLYVFGVPSISWSGDITMEVSGFIDKCGCLEGKRAAVFVQGSFMGKNKTMKNIMKLMEKRGSFLFDFEFISNKKDAGNFACRLISAKKHDKGF